MPQQSCLGILICSLVLKLWDIEIQIFDNYFFLSNYSDMDTNLDILRRNFGPIWLSFSLRLNQLQSVHFKFVVLNLNAKF
jgi:hypothetical protein